VGFFQPSDTARAKGCGRDIVSTLRAVVTTTFSIEHEDSYMSIDEGLQGSIYRTILFKELMAKMWWRSKGSRDDAESGRTATEGESNGADRAGQNIRKTPPRRYRGRAGIAPTRGSRTAASWCLGPSGCGKTTVPGGWPVGLEEITYGTVQDCNRW